MAETLPGKEEYSAVVERLGALVGEFEALPYPQLRDKAADLLEAVDALHRRPLERLVAILGDSGQPALMDQLADDPLVRQLLVLYDLIPCDEVVQVEAALYPFRPYVQAHGGDIEVVGAANGIVRIRLSGTCQGCASSTDALRRSIEDALRSDLPGFKDLWLEGVDVIPGEDGRASTGAFRECP